MLAWREQVEEERTAEVGGDYRGSDRLTHQPMKLRSLNLFPSKCSCFVRSGCDGMRRNWFWPNRERRRNKMHGFF